MNIRKIKSALYNALKNDFAINLYATDKSRVIFSFYPLDKVYNGLIKMYYTDSGTLCEDAAYIDFQFCPKTKKAENLLKRFSAALAGCTREQIAEFSPVFEYYTKQAKKVYAAKFSICVGLYTVSEDIKNYREVYINK